MFHAGNGNGSAASNHFQPFFSQSNNVSNQAIGSQSKQNRQSVYFRSKQSKEVLTLNKQPIGNFDMGDKRI